MGRIPTVTSQIASRSGRTTGGVPSPRASADAFGAAQGRGLAAIGQGAADLAQGIHVMQEAKRKEDAANAVAQTDFTRRELELRNEVGADASGYQERTLDEYDAWVEEQAESIEDDKTRQIFKNRMAAQRASVSSRAAQYEFSTAAEHSRSQANASLTALDNKIRLDPSQYDEFIDQGLAVIDARQNVPANVKEDMKTKWREASALSRFEGMLEGATSLEDVRIVQAELRGDDGRDWTSELSSAGLERVTTLADAASRAIQTKADADARAAIDILEGRADDVTSLIPQEEIDATEKIVAASSNPLTQARMERIKRNQGIVRETRRMTPAQQRDVMNVKYNNPSLPPVLNTAISRAATTFGVSAAYLAATAKREYGQQMKGDPDTIDWGIQNVTGDSSATGVMQFIDSTWLGVVKDPAFQAAVGRNFEGMSNAELLELRKDVDLNVMGGAFFTAQNMKIARRALGHEPTDADLYMMHFMGAGGASRLFRLSKTNPDMDAVHLFPEQAKANKTVFHNKDGSSRTVREVYLELGRLHGTGEGSETYVEYGDRETRQSILDETEKRLADDPMDFALRNGVARTGDIFQPGGMHERGEQARAVADYYNIATEDMQPFTKDEAQRIRTAFKDGSADDALSILTSIQQMGGAMARAAMSQIGEDSDVFAYAGGLQLETGQGGVAADVVRGQKRLDENPAIARETGAKDEDIDRAFMNATGGALLDASPAQRQAIRDAAFAHYVETQTARGRAGTFDGDRFADSVQAVLGGRQGSPAIDEVNGAKTTLPPGLTGDVLEEAFENMTVADWTAMSEQGVPPRYSNGEIADPDDLAGEAQLRAIGGGRYRVAVSDGSYLITGDVAPNGQLEPYIMVPTAGKVQRVIADGTDRRKTEAEELRQIGDRSGQAADVAAALEGGITPEEQQALFAKYGALWAYDSDGNRLVDQ